MSVSLQAQGAVPHDNLHGLPGGDAHTQYLLLAGRSGGQAANGGIAAGEILDLQGANNSPDVGIVRINSPVTLNYDTFSNTTPAQQFMMRWAPTPAISSNYVGGALQTAGVFAITTGVFIPAIFSDTNRYNVGAAPGFSAITFINELSVVANNGNFNLPSALVMNVGLVHERTSSGTSTTPGTTGTNFSPQTRATVSGAVMTKTAQTGLRIAPTFSTVAGSTVNLGTINGIEFLQPAVALFQPAAGTENMTAYYGLNFPNMTFGGANRVISVVRSLLNAATNVRFLDHTGTAQSRLGGQLLFPSDLTGITFGAGSDLQLGWAGAGFYFWQFNALADQLRFSNPAADRFLFDTNGGNSVAEFNLNCARFSLGAQTGAVGNQVGVFVAPALTWTVNGEFSQFLLSQAGNITVNANGDAFGWTINAPSFTAGTGTLTTAAALNVGGNPGLATTNRVGVRILSNPSGGSGINAALWVTAGLSRFDGRVDINNGVALGGGAAATLGTIGGSGPTAAAQAQWVEIDIGGTPHWIAVWT